MALPSFGNLNKSSALEDVDPIDSERINEYYEQAWSDFDIRADPADVTDSIDAVIYEFEELSGIQSITSEMKKYILQVCLL